MKVGLTYNLKIEGFGLEENSGDTLQHGSALAEDAFEEFDSIETIEAIGKVLNALGHTVFKLGFGRSAAEKILADPPDFVFNLAEGWGGRSREAQMPALLEMLDISYSGPDPLTAALTLDKVLAKKVAAGCGVATPWYAEVAASRENKSSDYTFPVILKPVHEGSSKGIRLHSKVDNLDALQTSLKWLCDNYPGNPVMVEQFIAGREFTVGIIGNAPAEVLGIMEIKPKHRNPKDFIYSLEVKRNYLAEVEYFSPPQIEIGLKTQLEEAALRLYRAFGCRDVARFDFRTDADLQTYFLEVNPLPGLNPVSSDLVIMANLLGINYPTLIERVFNCAVERCKLQPGVCHEKIGV